MCSDKGATPVYDGDTLVGAKINGVLVEGMDPNTMDSGDNRTCNKVYKKVTEDKKKKKKNSKRNWGNHHNRSENLPTVVPSQPVINSKHAACLTLEV